MIDILEKLKHKEIINDKNVLELRNYISINYPHISSYEASLLFADSIHKILDDNIECFDKSHRDYVKKTLISNSVHKSSFTINANDIFNAIISLDIDSYSYLEGLTDWINKNQDIEISKDHLLDFITEVRKYDKEYLNDSIHDMIEGVDFSPEDDISKDNKEEAPYKKTDIVEKQLDSKIMTSDKVRKSTKGKNLGIIIGIFLVTLFSLTIYIKITNDKNVVSVKAADDVKVPETRTSNELPVEFKYIDIDIEKLRVWLNSRDSKLADEPYLTTIVNTSETFDINPLLLIAITGQEQGFVPRSNEYAEKIANNPFNVYGSWKKHNKDINDSTKIAAITIVNLSKNRPSHIDPVKWINRKYAEDENWHKGVSKIFYMLCKELEVN
ncbi:hypothetical protein [Brassicibacter mesophilus]|uniref:hypothetical protein n=1 Tax=Brassicibacter mesophilus TaxID=745119 RepID=UPI003D1BD857